MYLPAVGNDGDVVTAPTQFTGYAGVEVGIISKKGYALSGCFVLIMQNN